MLESGWQEGQATLIFPLIERGRALFPNYVDGVRPKPHKTITLAELQAFIESNEDKEDDALISSILQNCPYHITIQLDDRGRKDQAEVDQQDFPRWYSYSGQWSGKGEIIDNHRFRQAVNALEIPEAAGKVETRSAAGARIAPPPSHRTW